MASTDAKAFPIKNQAYRVTFPILDADGDLVTAAAALDSEVSKDGATFADCTSEATEIATGSGMYFLDLTATEMNADTVAVIVKTTSTGAKTTAMVFYPLEDADLRVNVAQWAGSATATTNIALKTTLAKTTDITGFNDISTANVQTELTTYGGLKPTTAGRTLDVTATGEAGIDWSNIGAPTTTQNLSATTISTAQAVTVADKTGYSLTAAYDPAKTAAQVGSQMTLTAAYDPAKNAMQAGTAVTLTAAYDAAKLAAPVGAAMTLTPAYDACKTSMQAGSTVVLTSAYDAAKTAAAPGAAMTLTSVYDAAKTAASQANVATELNNYGAVKPTTPGTTLDISANGNAGIDWANIDNNNSYRELLNTYVYNVANVTAVSQPVSTNKDFAIDTIKATTDKLNTALEIDGTVYRYTTNALEQAPTGSGGGGGAGWDEVLPGTHAAGTAGYILGHNLDAQVSSRLPTTSYIVPPSAIQNATATRDIDNSLPAPGSWGAATNAAAAAGDPWATPLPSASYLPGTAGDIIGNKIDVAVSTRLAAANYTAPYSPTVIAQTTRDINNQTPATNSWGAATNAAASAGDPWVANIGNYTTPGTAGKLFNDQLDAKVSTRMPASSYVVPPSAATIGVACRDTDNTSPAPGSVGAGIKSAAAAGDPWATPLPSVTYPPGTAGDLIGQNIDAKISTRLPTSTYVPAPSASIVAQSVRDVDNSAPAANSLGADVKTGGADPLSKPVPGSYAAGTAGKVLGDNLNATVSSRSTYSGSDTSGTTELLTRIPSPITVTLGKVDINDKTGFSLTPAYDAAKNSAKPGDEMAVSAADKQSIALTVWGILTNAIATAGTMGKLIVDQLNASVGSRLAASNYVAPDNASITAIKLKTDTIPPNPALTTDVPTAAQVATATRDISNASPAVGSFGADAKAGSLVTDVWA
jgi:hypothetical protein